jgi:hypothetical protein
LLMTAFSSVPIGKDPAKAFAATGNSCDECIKAVQKDRAVCNFLIRICGVDWFVDPCEFSPGALCECATGCDSGGSGSSSTAKPGS